MPIYKGDNEVTSGNLYKGSTEIEDGYKATSPFYSNKLKITGFSISDNSSVTSVGFSSGRTITVTGEPGAQYNVTTTNGASAPSASGTIPAGGTATHSIAVLANQGVARNPTWTVVAVGSDSEVTASPASLSISQGAVQTIPVGVSSVSGASCNQIQPIHANPLGSSQTVSSPTPGFTCNVSFYVNLGGESWSDWKSPSYWSIPGSGGSVTGTQDSALNPGYPDLVLTSINPNQTGSNVLIQMQISKPGYTTKTQDLFQVLTY